MIIDIWNLTPNLHTNCHFNNTISPGYGVAGLFSVLELHHSTWIICKRWFKYDASSLSSDQDRVCSGPHWYVMIILNDSKRINEQKDERSIQTQTPNSNCIWSNRLTENGIYKMNQMALHGMLWLLLWYYGKYILSSQYTYFKNLASTIVIHDCWKCSYVFP